MKNSERTDYYVYEHLRLDTGETCYIGKGRGSRRYYKTQRNKYHTNIIKRHGVKSKVIAEGLTEEEALKLERNLICFAKTLGMRLCNMTVGGDGTREVEYTNERRAKISGQNHWLYQNGGVISGSKNPNHRQVYITPAGTFESHRDAARLMDIPPATVYYRCSSNSKKFSEWQIKGKYSE